MPKVTSPSVTWFKSLRVVPEHYRVMDTRQMMRAFGGGGRGRGWSRSVCKHRGQSRWLMRILTVTVIWTKEFGRKTSIASAS